MSDQANTERAQQFYETLGRGDIPALLDFVADDIEWTYQGPSAIPFAGTRHGREGVGEFFTLLDQTLEFEAFEPREFVAQGDTVVALGYERNRLKQSGRTVEQEWVHVFTFRDGKIVKVRSFENTAAFVAALNTD